jgi:hypothetical protein
MKNVDQIINLSSLLKAQAVVLRTAAHINSEQLGVTTTRLAYRIYGPGYNKPNLSQIRSVVSALRKKGWWQYTRDGRMDTEYNGPIFKDDSALTASPDGLTWTVKPEPINAKDYHNSILKELKDRQATILDSDCVFCPDPETARHNFAIKTLEEYVKLDRASQRRLWAAVREVADEVMPMRGRRNHDDEERCEE